MCEIRRNSVVRLGNIWFARQVGAAGAATKQNYLKFQRNRKHWLAGSRNRTNGEHTGRGEGTGIISVLARQNIAVDPLRNWRHTGVYSATLDLAARHCVCIRSMSDHECTRASAYIKSVRERLQCRFSGVLSIQLIFFFLQWMCATEYLQ